MADHETYSQTPSGANVTDTETLVTDTSIATFAADGEKIFNADFGTKKTYKLYDYTVDPTETTFNTYDSTARTAKASGFAGNAGLFAYHIGLMKFLPLVVVHMYPALFAKAASTIANMSRANYFYIIAFPEYSGYRVEQDPTLTAYIAAASSTSTPTNQPTGGGGIILIALIIAAVAIGAAVIKLRRKPKQQLPSTQA
jgi:tetrahydromethanopterin S-methyltransferase subunit B